MKFVNRITGQIFNQLPENALLGEWLIINESDNLKVNDVLIPSNLRFYLWVNNSNNIHLFSDSRTQNLGNIKIPKWQIASDILRESIAYFYYQSHNLNINQDNWKNWLNLSPLVPEINAKIHLQTLEIDLQKQWGHLENVCRRPRTYLKMETEKLAISRAKKIANGAIEHLASHSEDWYRRNFNSVKPNKLLCLVREDLLNIYENQVTAKLIDNLLEYISRRIAELKLIENELKEAMNFSDEMYKIYRRNRNRISSLWGQQFDAEIGILELEETLKELNDKKRKLLGLITTDLYKAIPKQTYVPMTLKRTNIFVNDQHYKYIDLLWRNWSKWKTRQIKNPQQFFEEYQQFFQGFEAFCLLLICKTFCGNNDNNDQGLNFEPIFNQDLKHNQQDTNNQNNLLLSFQGLLGKIDLYLSKNRTFYLSSDLINQDLCLIPLGINLTGINDEKEINNILDKLFAQVDNSCHNIILYLGTKEEQNLLSKNLQNRLNNILIQNNNLTGIFPVNPFEILSLERVAYTIKWWLYGNLYLSYPPVLNLSLQIPDNLLTYFHGCLTIKNNRELNITAFISNENINNFNRELTKEIKRVESMGKQGRSQLAELRNIQNHDLPNQINQLIQPFTICPVCNHQEDLKNIEKLNNHSFQCHCSQCGSSWGTKHCGNCDKNYPFIAVQGIENKELNYNPLNLDRVFGRDILAIPTRKDDHNIGFICCFCGSK
ncbi:hypothetical protein VKI21_07285 [Cyanobacterium aponinum UTEX 3222]|uniref:hypothetical protein n=1 Tax=Cyanobacterium aponinum TaxID=379064 RepID=UPI0030887F1E|nr:hypothetical protein VKI21_07285 [Cyanobacterium aponinum UTEX 3222]